MKYEDVYRSYEFVTVICNDLCVFSGLYGMYVLYILLIKAKVAVDEFGGFFSVILYFL